MPAGNGQGPRPCLFRPSALIYFGHGQATCDRVLERARQASTAARLRGIRRRPLPPPPGSAGHSPFALKDDEADFSLSTYEGRDAEFRDVVEKSRRWPCSAADDWSWSRMPTRERRLRRLRRSRRGCGEGQGPAGRRGAGIRRPLSPATRGLRGPARAKRHPRSGREELAQQYPAL